MEGLLFKYKSLNNIVELDDLKWNTVPKGTIYTISSAGDYNPDLHPAETGCVEILRYGGNSTMQIFHTESKGTYYRTFNSARLEWSAWNKN